MASARTPHPDSTWLLFIQTTQRRKNGKKYSKKWRFFPTASATANEESPDFGENILNAIMCANVGYQLSLPHLGVAFWGSSFGSVGSNVWLR